MCAYHPKKNSGKPPDHHINIALKLAEDTKLCSQVANVFRENLQWSIVHRLYARLVDFVDERWSTITFLKTQVETHCPDQISGGQLVDPFFMSGVFCLGMQLSEIMVDWIGRRCVTMASENCASCGCQPIGVETEQGGQQRVGHELGAVCRRLNYHTAVTILSSSAQIAGIAGELVPARRRAAPRRPGPPVRRHGAARPPPRRLSSYMRPLVMSLRRCSRKSTST